MNITEIMQLSEQLEIAFINGKEAEILPSLIAFQRENSVNFSIDDLGLMRFTKNACVSLADAYLSSELYNQAAVILGFLLKYFPENNDLQEKYSSSMLAVAEVGIQNGLNNDARVLLFELLKRNEDNIFALIDLGVLDVLEQNFQNGEKIFQKVLVLEPNNEIAIENLQYILQTADNN